MNNFRRFHFSFCFVLVVFWATFCCGETVPSELVDESLSIDREQITVEQDDADDLPLPPRNAFDPFPYRSDILFSVSSVSLIGNRMFKTTKSDLSLIDACNKSVRFHRLSLSFRGKIGQLYNTIRPHLLFQHLLI